jgi:hypothetical protein
MRQVGWPGIQPHPVGACPQQLDPPGEEGLQEFPSEALDDQGIELGKDPLHLPLLTLVGAPLLGLLTRRRCACKCQ